METLHDLTQATGGRILSTDRIQDPAAVALGRIVADSHKVEPDDVFWALQGPNYDGACFLHEAFRRGAQGVVVSQGETISADGWTLVVDDAQRALEQWARWKRRHFTGLVIGVTGSASKTATRQMIHTVLQGRLQGTASPPHYNHPWSVALNMTATEPQHDYAVLEFGASRAGEITLAAELSAPKVGVIAQAGDAPPDGFGNRHGVAESELLAALPRCGQAVLADDSWLRTSSPRCAAPITWIGVGPQCDLRAVDVECRQARLEFHVACGEGPRAPCTQGRAARGHHVPMVGGEQPQGRSKRPLRFSIPVWGRHHIHAALAAVAVGRMVGLDLEEIAAALADFPAAPMRCDVSQVRGATIINDACNANPAAMRAALEFLHDFEGLGRRIVVCGDMAELGTQAIVQHWQMGKEMVQVGGAELVIACGRFARHVTAGARSTGLNRARAIPCDTAEDAMPFLAQIVLPGDIVLVKGLRATAMECLIGTLKPYSQRKAA